MLDQLEKELLDVDLSGISVKITPKHPKSAEFTKTISEMLMNIGVPPKLSDLADACLYMFPHLKNDDICIAFLIWHFWAFLLDDQLERNPKGSLDLFHID